MEVASSLRIIEPGAVLEIRSHSVIVLDAHVVRFGEQAEICTLVQSTRPSQPPPRRAQIVRRPRPRCWPCPVQLALPVQAVSTSAMLGPGEPGAGGVALSKACPQVPGQVSLSPGSQEAGKPQQQGLH